MKIDNDDLHLSDEEYERLIYENQKKAAENAKKAAEEKEAQRVAEAKEREKQLAKEHIELMKMRNGLMEEDSSEIIANTPEPVRMPKTRKEKLANFWYHYKVAVIMIVFAAAVITFITIDSLSRDKPDITILFLCANGGAYRTDELEIFFEQFTEDYNGDGKVHVQIIDIPLNPHSTDYQTVTATQAKLMTQMQSGEAIICIADTMSEGELEYDKTLYDMTELFPNSEYAVEKGYLLTNEKLKTDWSWEAMPQDMYIGMRTPMRTVGDSEATMQRNFNYSLEVLTRVVAYLES